MNVAFACDDRPQSGLGHVVRCQALADALQARGHKTRQLPFGFNAIPPCDLLVVDSYAATAADFQDWSARAPVCVIDDLADRDLRAAALVINQNFGAELLEYRSSNARILRGPHFAMLRSQFHEQRDLVHRAFSPGDRRVLITLGGGIVESHLQRLIASLDSVEYDLELQVIGIDSASKVKSRHALELLGYTETIAHVMVRSDICITAGGVTTLELACLGTPAIVLTLAPNQEPGARAIHERGAGISLGAFDKGLPNVASALQAVLADPFAREGMSRAGSASVDGCGAQHVVEVMETISR
ncbi:MAG: hypothetical protein M3N19_11005 [Candidatus Eremiobacteraeota bacterium]|nr:hypothetical protein [Candidatus Eremiobacteraeota bacterium]